MEQADFTEEFRGLELRRQTHSGKEAIIHEWVAEVSLRGTGENSDGDYTLWDLTVSLAGDMGTTRYRGYVIREGALGVGVSFRQRDPPRKGVNYDWYKGEWKSKRFGPIDWMEEEVVDWILAMDDLIRGIGLSFPLLESTPSAQPNPFYDLWNQDKH